MKRRDAIHAVVVLGAVAAGAWFALRTMPRPGPPPICPGRAAFTRLHEGMTLAEVEAVMGPAGFDLSSHSEKSYFVWKGPDGWSRVWLDGGPVRTVRRLEFDPAPPE